MPCTKILGLSWIDRSLQYCGRGILPSNVGLVSLTLFECSRSLAYNGRVSPTEIREFPSFARNKPTHLQMGLVSVSMAYFLVPFRGWSYHSNAAAAGKVINRFLFPRMPLLTSSDTRYATVQGPLLYTSKEDQSWLNLRDGALKMIPRNSLCRCQRPNRCNRNRKERPNV